MPTAPTAPPQTANPIRMLVPPEERFWKRYSPHHEAPLSGFTSTAVHVLFLALVGLVIWVHQKKTEEENRPLPVDVVRIPGGGGPSGGPDPGGPVLDKSEEAG